MSPSFSVITPCYNANAWIRACVASVADQTGIPVQHVIQDGGSTDGTAEYVLSESRVEGESKRDKGMYDAINQGWAKCTGDFVIHLNADEQLLPGALEAVSRLFKQHPELDVVLGGTLICEADGTLHCVRKAIHPPLSILLTSHHPIPSCAVFLRRVSFVNRPWLYDPGFRLISDVLLMVDIVRGDYRIGVLDRYTSVFSRTGTNMGLTQSENARHEYAHQTSLAKRWMLAMKSVFRALFTVRRALAGHYSERALRYLIYANGHTDARKEFVVPRPSGVYRPEQTTDLLQAKLG